VTFIPPLDLTRQYHDIQTEVEAAVMAVLASGRYIGGQAIETFEQKFAQYIGAKEGIACNSGTDALYLALRVLGIGAGDEVITSPFTFIATAEMISAVGATPVFIDIDADTFNLNLEQIEAAITPRTKAIMPVHLFGQPVDMTRVMAIAHKHHLAVIEDCAQAVGAQWQGQTVGSIGHIGCFSFYPTKNLGACGDGGAITTNDATLTAKMRVLRNHGQSQTYIHEAIGVNSRLDAIQAVILGVKLQYLDRWNEQRRAIAARYHALLASVPGVVAPQEVAGGHHVWHQYTIRLTEAAEQNGDQLGQYRNTIRQAMQQHEIGCMVYYPVPLHRQPVYESLGYGVGSLPVAERVANQVLSLPMFPELTLDEQQMIVKTLQQVLEKSPQAIAEASA
jgi:dTDP-4-amino-4,6-dideoxygalactose transaminase